MKKVGFVGVALAAVAISTGCGGGGSSTPPAPVVTASPSPSPVPPGPLAVSWSNAGPVVPLPIPGPQVLNSNGSSAAPPAASLAPTQSLTFTASQSNNVGGYTAALSGTGCSAPAVTLSSTTSTTGVFTVGSSATAAPATCSLTISGASGTASVSTSVAVLTEGAVTLLWTAPGITLQTAPPYAGNQGPILLIGPGSALAANLYASEANFIGGFTATVTCPTGSSGIQVSTVGGTAGSSATSATGAFAVTATASAVSPPSNACTIGVTDANGKAASPSIAVTLNITTGIVN